MIHMALHLRWHRFQVSRKEARGFYGCSNPETQRIYKKGQREIDYSNQ